MTRSSAALTLDVLVEDCLFEALAEARQTAQRVLPRLQQIHV